MDKRKIIQLALQHGFDAACVAPLVTDEVYMPNAEAIRQNITNNPFAILTNAGGLLLLQKKVSYEYVSREGYANLPSYYPVSNESYRHVIKLVDTLNGQGITCAMGNRLPLKRIFQKAGEGQCGMHTLLMNQACGSNISLEVIILAGTVKDFCRSGEALKKELCTKCTACLKACPTGALQPYKLDDNRCLRKWSLSGEVMPLEYRNASGLSLIGCEMCQKECPVNGTCQKEKREPPDCLRIDRLLRADKAELSELAQLIGVNLARKERIQAQAALIAGNSKNSEYLPWLEMLAQHPRLSIREHATWAAKQLKL